MNNFRCRILTVAPSALLIYQPSYSKQYGNFPVVSLPIWNFVLLNMSLFSIFFIFFSKLFLWIRNLCCHIFLTFSMLNYIFMNSFTLLLLSYVNSPLFKFLHTYVTLYNYIVSVSLDFQCLIFSEDLVLISSIIYAVISLSSDKLSYLSLSFSRSTGSFLLL